MDDIQILHIITEPTRFHLLQLLLEHHYCVKAMAKKIGISEPAVSQHMRLLKQHKIVEGIKIGYQTHYQIKKEKVIPLLKAMLDQFSQCSPGETIGEDFVCTCEYISECIKRDSKIFEAQNYGK